MSLRINTNIPALIALQNLSANDTEMNSSILRLSTGLRINTGADDPAGLIISENMRSELQGISQAIRNTQDATNMAKTADGALDEVQRLLLDMRGLAVHAANSGVVDANTVQADQTQVASIITSINRIASTTQFGTKKLFDGTAGAVANVTNANDISSIFVGGTFGGNTVQSGPITLTSTQPATKAIITLGQSFATATSTVAAGSVVVNGVTINTDGTETVGTLVSKINAQASLTGVTAELSGSGPVNVVLKQNNYGGHFGITFFDSSQVVNNAASANATGQDAVFNVSATTSAGLQTVTFTGGRGGQDSGLKLTDTYGNVIVLSETGNATITGIATSIAEVTAGSVNFQVGPDSDQSVSFSMPVMFASNIGTGAITGKSISDIDLTTTAGAQEAMKIIEDAVTQVSQIRGVIGSFQKNILQSGQRSLQIANENLTASESEIRDVDMASEMTHFTKLQILKQSGISVLAQANQQPQSVLKLLQ